MTNHRSFKPRTVIRRKTCMNQSRASEKKKKRKKPNNGKTIAEQYQAYQQLPKGISVPLTPPSEEQKAFARKQAIKRGDFSALI